MRRTRIVCTMGPASMRPAVLRRLIRSGMDVARFNFSHGESGEQEQAVLLTRRLAGEAGRHVALLQDLQGPKIRTGSQPQGPIELRRGTRVRLYCATTTDPARGISIDQPELVRVLRPRDRVLIQDGEIQLRVLAGDGEEASCQIVQGGLLRGRQGVIVPERDLDLPALTERDLTHLALGVELGFDYLAISFVSSAADVEGCRAELRRRGASTPIVAKLERARALPRLDEIVESADAVMVARGDLGVELPMAEVPAVQKNIIDRANRAGRPVITATEMLESMVHSGRPTRAEASDVANAIWDGSDAVMLSQETSIGDHPVLVLQAMDRICRAAERHPAYRRVRPSPRVRGTVSGAIAISAAGVAEEIGARAIVAFTESGATALRVSKARPRPPILAASPNAQTLRRTALLAGVVPLEVVAGRDTDDMIERATAAARRSALVRPGDLIVIVAGTPVGESGRTNLVRVARVEPASAGPDAVI